VSPDKSAVFLAFLIRRGFGSFFVEAKDGLSHKA
jgi:hypothetical protein